MQNQDDLPVALRAATIRDVPAIADLITYYAQKGRMLFRSHAELYETLRDFTVCTVPDPTDPRRQLIAGVCALEIVWADLAEVKSLAVAAQWTGRKLGRRLVEAVEKNARDLEIQRLFALTYEPVFFDKMGFSVVDRHSLPLKVWSACVKCPKRDGCDEIAVVKQLFDNPVFETIGAPQSAHYEVPTALVQLQGRQGGGPSTPQSYTTRGAN